MKCEKMMKTGKRCNAYAVTDTKYCFLHSDDPVMIKKREEALQKASDSKKLFLPITSKAGKVAVAGEDSSGVSLNFPKFVDLSKAKGIKKAYITIIRAAAEGALDVKTLGPLTYALNGYVNAIEKIDLMERIEVLERIAQRVPNE